MRSSGASRRVAEWVRAYVFLRHSFVRRALTDDGGLADDRALHALSARLPNHHRGAREANECADEEGSSHHGSHVSGACSHASIGEASAVMAALEAAEAAEAAKAAKAAAAKEVARLQGVCDKG